MLKIFLRVLVAFAPVLILIPFQWFLRHSVTFAGVPGRSQLLGFAAIDVLLFLGGCLQLLGYRRRSRELERLKAERRAILTRFFSE